MPTEEEFYLALCRRHGTALQERIRASRAAVCGLGGLGSNIAVALARAGIGWLHLIDFDRVDITNLNRQQYFVRQLGEWKTEALKDTLLEIAPYCQVSIDTVKVTEENIPKLLREDTYICEAFDNPEAKAMLVSGVLEHFPDKYLVAGSGMAGLGTANSIHTRRISSHFYLCGDEMSDSGEGMSLISSRVMVCAAHEANMILRLIAGETEA